MEVNLNTTSAVQQFAAVTEALKGGALVAPAVTTPVLAGENVSVTTANVDLDALLAQLRMETNEARLAAARSRLSSALEQLTGLSGEQQEKVSALKTTGEQLTVAEMALDEAKAAYTEKTKDVDRAQKAVDAAEKAVEKANDRLNKAESALVTAQAELDAFKQVNTANAPGLTELEAAVATAETELANATTAVTLATATLDKATATLNEAKDAANVAEDAYRAAEKVVNDLLATFDQQLHDLDSGSIQALREAVQLTAGDLDHLHDEIEEEDKQHSLATVRSVEDVIADSLKRMDGEMVDEVESRHLDHI